MASEYEGNNTNDLTSRLQDWGRTTGRERYHRSLQRTVTRKDEAGNEISKTVEVKDVERDSQAAGIIEQSLDLVVGMIASKVDAEMDRLSQPYPGQPKKGMPQIAGLDYTAAAMTALSSMWEDAGTTLGHQRRIMKIGERCQSLARRQAMDAQIGYRSKTLHKKAQRKYDAKERQDSWLDYKAERAGIAFEPWDKQTRVYVGSELHSAVLEATNLFIEKVDLVKGKARRKDNPGGMSTKHVLVLSDETAAELRSKRARAEWMEPLFPPMGQPPLAWGPYEGAPYPDAHLSANVPFVRGMGRDQRLEMADALDDNRMPLVIEAVNHLQDVPFEINQGVWEVVQWCFDNALEPCDSFPPQTEMPVDMKLDLASLKAANDNGDAVTDAKIKQADALKHNMSVRAHLITSSYLSTVVDKIGDLPFWLPHNLDFRSRMYPVPLFSYQAADHIKALHYFVLRKPLGEAGLKWLYIHLAGCADFKIGGQRLSKLTLQQRVDWATDNEEQLLAVARDFRTTYSYWKEADKPFSFVAACMELLRAVEHYEKHGNWNYLCGLPVSVDGACSGYQHYSAAMRASKEAALVNLVASDKPQDIYQFIADQVTVVVRKDADAVTDNHCTSDDQEGMSDCDKKAIAKLWLKHGITRKVCKRPVMTSGYNSNAYGFTDQIMQDVMEKLNRRVIDPKDSLVEHPFAFGRDKRGFTAAKYLAQIIYDKVRLNLSAATDGMDFFKECLSAWSRRGEHFCMSSPLGFPFFQDYSNHDTIKVKPWMWSNGVRKRVQVTLRADNDNGDMEQTVWRATSEKPPVHRNDSLNAISANLTHMADACHMQLSICQARREGINNLMMIHDSFGTTPGEMDTLYHIVREQFINLYTNYDPFAEVLRVTQWVNDGVDERVPSLDREGNPRLTRSGEVRTKRNPNYIDLPELPERGDLDLRQVANSIYCFI